MHTLIRTVVDAIYPPQCVGCTTLTDAPHGLCPACWSDVTFITGLTCSCCGTPLPGEAAEDVLCDICLQHPLGWNRGRAAVLYSGTGRRVTLSLKHGDRLDLAKPLATWMARAGRDLVVAADIVAPVPLHWTRLLRRRYNQSAELARQPALRVNADFLPDLLIRTRRTAIQEGMERAARFANQQGAFRVKPHHTARLEGKTVLLIDDVMTTGATLSACADACRQGGAAAVNVLVLARVARD